MKGEGSERRWWESIQPSFIPHADQNPEEEASKTESKWTTGKEQLSRSERRAIIAKVIEIAIRETFKNHAYRFDGQLYRQMKGGAIGL